MSFLYRSSETVAHVATPCAALMSLTPCPTVVKPVAAAKECPRPTADDASAVVAEVYEPIKVLVPPVVTAVE
jgi:hypothetical protein